MIPPKTIQKPTKKKSFVVHYTAPAAGGSRRRRTTPSDRRRGNTPKRRKSFFGDIERITERNKNYRQVLYTGPYEQLVVMSLNPGDSREIGPEVHKHTDQFFRVESGHAKIVVGNNRAQQLGPGDAAIIPAGTRHNVINMSKTKPLKLYTIYSPPHHPPHTVLSKHD
jgi:mannose-6-phosphate isomerase-like protein (cupin superfamily)